MLMRVLGLFLVPLTLLIAPLAFGAEASHDRLDLTSSWVGLASIFTFIAAYALVIGEEYTHLPKSKPVILAAGIIWAMIALVYVFLAHPLAKERQDEDRPLLDG